MELRGYAAVEKFSSMVILCVLSLLSSLAADLSPAQQEFSKIVQEQKDAQQQWQDAYTVLLTTWASELIVNARKAQVLSL